MKKILFLLSIFLIQVLSAQTLKNVIKKGKDAANSVKTVTNTSKLSNEEVVQGLKEALRVGTNVSSDNASKADGYLKNPRIFIPWPPEALEMKERLLKMGFSKNIEEFEISLNRAAEEAAKSSAPVFTSAIANMSVQDGFAILKSNDTAATNYLRKTTYNPLEEKFTPIVKEAIEKVNVTSYWNPLVTAYNKVPGVRKQNPDLHKYVTNKAINGLLLLISDEEIKIRKDPKARVNDILKKVFGS
jgi:hypothetical protein